MGTDKRLKCRRCRFPMTRCCRGDVVDCTFVLCVNPECSEYFDWYRQRWSGEGDWPAESRRHVVHRKADRLFAHRV